MVVYNPFYGVKFIIIGGALHVKPQDWRPYIHINILDITKPRPYSIVNKNI